MTTEWFLKKPDGAVYGPVDTTGLKAWATSGRIEPDDTVSTDQKEWRAARDVSALMMNWTVELADGRSFGPVPLEALVQLLADGAITLRSPIRHSLAREATTLETLLEKAAAPSKQDHSVSEAEHRLAEQEQIAEQRIHFLEEELRRERISAEEARTELQTAETQHRDILRQLRDLNDRYIRLRDQTQGAARH